MFIIYDFKNLCLVVLDGFCVEIDVVNECVDIILFCLFYNVILMVVCD